MNTLDGTDTGPSPELVWDAHATLGEGPVWVDRDSSLYWVDIKQHAIHRLSWPSREERSWHVHEQIGVIQPMMDGRFVGGLKDGVYAVSLEPEKDEASLEKLLDPEPNCSNNRINDGKIGPDGAFWFGTMDDNESEPTGKLYRLTGTGELSVVDIDYVITNGPGFSPDGSTMYHTDTLKRKIYAFDVDQAGHVSNKRLFISHPVDAGYPDGMGIDDEGCIWIGHFGGWRLTRYSPEGTPVSELPMPVANNTSCSFGGEELRTLFITTASKGLSDGYRANQPMAGGLFAIEVDTAGMPTRYFDWSV